ncbi:hypothetical protein HDU97_002806 [Phlyctochytrium planicorne]|nr:hypothetical protein HDU97_002806 [Phlyctochytrium planicorne]
MAKDIQSFTSQYVRKLLASPPRKRAAYDCVKEGRPFVEKCFAAVRVHYREQVMVDISGYTKLTSRLSAYGKISSELVTKSVCEYLDKIIDVVVSWGGDVIRFLGDAIIVAFRNNTTLSTSPDPSLIRRSILCSLHILQSHPSISMDVSQFHHVLLETTDHDPRQPYRTPTMSSASASTAQADLSDLKLTLHIGATAGIVQNVIVGDPRSRLDYVMYGTCLERLGDLLGKAKSGELAIDLEIFDSFLHPPETIHHLPDTFSSLTIIPSQSAQSFMEDFGKEAIALSTLPSLDTATDPIRPDDTSMILESFVNASIVTASMTSSASERRQSLRRMSIKSVTKPIAVQSQYRTISILFVKLLAPFSPDLAQHAITMLQEALIQHEGVFQQFAVDDKGQTMLACFGLPPWTHENESIQAARSAQQFRSKFSACPYAMSITTGTLLFTTLGNAMRSEASLLGDVVNQAARILSLASHKHPLVCDASTQSSITAFETTHMGAFDLKGIQTKIDVYHIDTPSESGKEMQDGQERMLGYSKEKEAMLSELGRWQGSKRNGLVVLEGASGLGKSSLLGFFLKHIVPDEFELCTTRIAAESELIPFSGLRNLFQHMIRQSITNPTAHPSFETLRRSSQLSIQNNLKDLSYGDNVRVRSHSIMDFTNDTKILSTLQDSLKNVNENPLLAPLFGMFFPNVAMQENELTLGLSQVARKVKLLALSTKLLKVWVARTRAVLVYDDLQWMDSTSQQVLVSLCTHAMEDLAAGQVFILLCTRPLDDTSGFKQVLELDKTVHMHLKGLEDSDIIDFVAGRNNASALTSEVSGKIISKTMRSPLALQLVVEVLQKKDTFAVVDDVVHFRSEKEVEIDRILDQTINASILLQFDRLTPEIQTFLKHASIFGQYFYLRDVMEIMNETDLEKVLTWIKEDQFSFLRPSDSTPWNPSFHFKHISIANAIHDSLPYEEQAKLHASIANVLESRMAESEKPTMLPLIYGHYCQTSNSEKRLRCGQELGILYQVAGYNREAVTVLKSLIQYANSLKEIPQGYRGNDQAALWNTTLAMAASKLYYLELTITSATACLNLSQWPFPTPSEVHKKLLKKRYLHQMIQMWKTKSGQKGFREGIVVNEQDTKVQRSIHIHNAFLALLWAIMKEDDATVKMQYKLMVAIEMLNHGISVRESVPWIWLESAVTAAFLFLFPMNSLSKKYFRSVELWAKTTDVGSWSRVAQIYLAYVISLADADEQLARLIPIYSAYFEKVGEAAGLQLMKNNRIYIKSPKCFAELEEGVLEKFDELWLDNAFLATSSLTLLIRGALMSKKMDKAEYYLERSEVLTMRNHETKDLLTLNTHMTRFWQFVFSKDVDKALEHFQPLSAFAKTSQRIISFMETVLNFNVTAVLHLTDAMRNDDGGSKTPSEKTKQRSKILISSLNNFIEMVNIYAKRVVRSRVSADLFYGLYFTAQGKRRKALSRFAKITKPAVVKTLIGKRPLWISTAQAGMWFLTGDERQRAAALTLCKEYELLCVSEWLQSAKPL